MTIRNLVIAPDKILTQKSEDIDKITDEIRQLGQDMFDTMYSKNGIGLAAVQIGVLKNLIVVDVEQKKDDDGNYLKENQYIMANPKLLNISDEKDSYNEGCLSFPKQNVIIERPNSIKVEYIDMNGDRRVLEANGMLAKCIQHEIEHTIGVNIINHASKIKQSMMIEKLLKIKKKL